KMMHLSLSARVCLCSTVLVVATADLSVAAGATALTFTASYSALAVIGALKFLAAKLLLLSVVRSGRSNQSYGYNNGYYGSGHGSHRYRRSTMDNEVDHVFGSLRSIDLYGCGLRLVCELEQKNYSDLQDEERLVISLFGRNPAPPSYLSLRSPRTAYDYAAWMGATKMRSCGDLFNKCPLTAQQMIAQFRLATAHDNTGHLNL
ncbi:unnamed protein product, partial [Meganyctiphanes norvegica]